MLAKLDGTIIATGQGGPSDHFHIEGGVEKNRHAIHGSIEDVLIHAGADGGDVVAVGLGLTGAPREGDQNPVVKDLVQELLPHLGRDRIVVEPDDRTNLAGASGGKPGVVLIAGGGCIAYGITSDGREAVSGGFGYLIGDEGSAFDIGVRAIQSACKASDARGPATVLEQVVREHIGIGKITGDYPGGLSRRVFSERIPADSPGRFGRRFRRW